MLASNTRVLQQDWYKGALYKDNSTYVSSAVVSTHRALKIIAFWAQPS